MMRGVVDHGTGKQARVDGYSAGGKTGSAQIYDYAARVYTHRYNGSFMGFAPVNKPAIVVVVTLNGVSCTISRPAPPPAGVPAAAVGAAAATSVRGRTLTLPTSVTAALGQVLSASVTTLPSSSGGTATTTQFADAICRVLQA